MLTSHAIRVALILAGSGALGRSVFRHFETRWQILIFWGIVLAYHFAVRPLLGWRVSPWSAALDAVCVAVAIVAVKVMIEGKL